MALTVEQRRSLSLAQAREAEELSTVDTLPPAEQQFMSYDEFLRDFGNELDSETRQQFESQARLINSSTYLSELSGVDVDTIINNYESFSKAHHYSGNHEADWQHIQGNIRKRRELIQKRYESLRTRDRFANAARSLVGSLMEGAAQTSGAIGTLAAELEDKFQNYIPQASVAELISGEIPKERGIEDQGFTKLSKWIRSKAEEFAPEDPALVDSFWSTKVPAAVGSMLFFMAGGAATKAPIAGAVILGGLQQAQSGFEDAISHGATHEEAISAFVLNAPLGATEAIPISRMLNRINKASGGGVVKALKDAGIEGLEEFAQEFSQTAISNEIAKNIYDENRNFLDGAIDSGNVGGVTGILMSLVISALPGKQRAKLQKIVEQPFVNSDIPSQQEWGLIRENLNDKQIQEVYGSLGVEAANGNVEAQKKYEENLVPPEETEETSLPKVPKEFTEISLQQPTAPVEGVLKEDTAQPPVKGIKAVPDADLAKFISEEDTALTTPLLDEAFGFTLGEQVPDNIVEADGKIEINGKKADPIPATDTTETERSLYKKELELSTEQFKTELNEDKSFTQAERNYFNALMEDQVFIELDEYGFERVKERDLTDLKKKAEQSRKGKLETAKINKRIKDAVAKARLQGEIAVLKERAKAEESQFSAEEKLANLQEAKTQAIKEVQFRTSQKIKGIKKAFRDRIAKIKEDARYKAAENKQAYLDERANTKEAVKQLRALIASLPPGARSRFPNSLFSRIAQAKTVDSMQKTIDAATERAADILDAYLTVLYRNALVKSVKRGVKRLKKAKEFKVFKKIERIGTLPREDTEAELAAILDKDEISPEEREQAFLLRIFGGKLNNKETAGFTPEELLLAVEEAAYIQREGRTRLKDRLQAEAKRNAERNRGTQEAIIGEGEPLTSVELDEKEDSIKGIAANIRSFLLDRLDGWETLVDNIAGTGKRFSNFLTETFVDPVFEAQRQEEVSNRSTLEAWGEAVLKITGKDKSTREILALSKEWGKRKNDHNISWVMEGQYRTHKMSAWEGITMWMQWQDKSLQPSFEKQKITKEDIKRLEEYIGPEGIEVAKYMLAQYEKGGVKFQSEMERIDGVSPGVVENYSPITRRLANGKEPDALQATDMSDFKKSTVRNSHMKERSKNTYELVFKPANRVFVEHTYAMNHFYAWGQLAKDLRNTFENPTIKRAIRQSSGTNETNNLIQEMINDMLRGGIDRAKMDRVVDELISNVAVSKLAGNLPSAIKQLTSIPAYADAMPAGEWLAYSAKFWALDGKFGERIKAITETDYIKDRISSGYERDLRKLASRNADRALANARTKRDKLMILTRMGDVGAIISGGWAVYQYNYDQAIQNGKTEAEAKDIATKTFVRATDRTQQSGKIFSQGYWQRGGAFMKMFTMFMTTPIQYQRVVNNAIRSKLKGRISTPEMLKTFFIFHILLPQIFQAMSSGLWGLFDDDEDIKVFKQRQLAALVTGNLNSLFIVGQVIEAVANLVTTDGKEAFLADTSSPILDLSEDLARGTAKIIIADDGEEFLDGADKAASALLSAGGIPYDPAKKQIDGMIQAVTGETDHPLLRFLGWGDYALNEQDN